MALVDCDSFYASCERVCRPDLRGKPLAVLSNNDGCIVAMSREAKRLGIPMGEPEFKVRHLLEKYNVSVFSSNYTLYGDLSRRVMQTIASVAPDIEVYSIDEAFVPLTGALAINADNVASLIRSRVLQWVGLPVSIGIAPTRVLAKIATRIAKKFPVYGGIFNLLHCKSMEKVLEYVPVKDIWGVGRKGAVKLKSAGIHTARDLRDADPELVRRLMTIHGLNILMELQGIPAIKEEVPASHCCIISSRSLGYKVTTLEPLEEAAAFHAARATEKLRLKKLVAQMVNTRICTAYYDHAHPQHDEMAMTHLSRPTDDTAVIITAAKTALKRIFRFGYGYAKMMVMLTDLSDPAKGQYDLIPPPPETREKENRRKALMALIDKINRVEGRGALTFAAQGSKDANWHMNRDRLSPAWTTDITQIPVVSGVGRHEMEDRRKP